MIKELGNPNFYIRKAQPPDEQRKKEIDKMSDELLDNLIDNYCDNEGNYNWRQTFETDEEENKSVFRVLKMKGKEIGGTFNDYGRYPFFRQTVSSGFRGSPSFLSSLPHG